MAYIKIEHKPANKFKMVQLEDQMKFQKLLSERENLVPCQLYVDKDDGTIYFVEQQTGAILDWKVEYYNQQMKEIADRPRSYILD